MNTQQITTYENNPEIIQKYVNSSAFGTNKIVYLPLIVGIASALFLGVIYFDGLIVELGNSLAIGLAILAIICFVSVFLINSAAKKKLSAETKFAPISIAKKIYGNDSQNLYYCIYAEGDKRHDQAFIERIAEKIFAIPNNTSDATEKEVSKLGKEGFWEANEMKKYLVAQNIPSEKILVDNYGDDTEKTVKNSIRIVDSLGYKSAISVSQYFHQTRTKALFKKDGFKNIESVSPDYFELRDLYSLFREFVAYYKEVIFG